MKRKLGMLAGLAVSSMVASTAMAGPIDIVLVVDESGSMSTEHAWIGGMVTALNTALGAKNQTDVRFSLVGFGNGLGGGQNDGRVLQNSVTAGAFSSAGLVLSGGTEDGYAGLNHAFGNVTFRAGSAQNFILITDEDRDNTNGALTFNSIKTALQARNALLNVVVDATLNDGAGGAPPPPPVLGITGIGPAAPIESYTQAGATTNYNVHVGGGVTSAAGTTLADYIQLAIQTTTILGKNGAAWDLNQLRAGGNTAAAFTNAFVDLKVEEIIQQIIPLPNAAWMGLAGLAGIGVIRRIRRKA